MSNLSAVCARPGLKLLYQPQDGEKVRFITDGTGLAIVTHPDREPKKLRLNRDGEIEIVSLDHSIQ